MKSLLFLLVALCVTFSGFAAPQQNSDPEILSTKGGRRSYKGVYPAHVKTIAVITPASYPNPKNGNAGIKLLRSTTNPLLGECPEPEIVEELRNCLLQCNGIKGVHDIIIHNYGPNQYFATAHAEVEPDGTLFHTHDMLEAAEIHVAKRMPIRLLLHCDPCNTSDPEVIKWRGKMEEIVSSHDCQLKLYDFRLKISDAGNLQLHFHLLIPRNYPLERDILLQKFTADIRKSSPEVELVIEFIDSYV